MAHMRELLRKNRKDSHLAVLRALMAKPSNQTRLAKRVGLSTGTVSEVIEKLESQGHVVKKRDGRANNICLPSPTGGVAVGIELGYHHVVVLARQAHEAYHEARRRESRTVGAATAPIEECVRVASVLVEEAVGLTGSALEELTTVGLAVPRMVDPDTKKLTEPLLPPWNGTQDPAEALTNRLRDAFGGRPAVRLDNDASLGALAESVYLHPDADTLLYVKCSTGVGSGIVINGQIFHGATGAAGELGHMRMRSQGAYCLCGGRGCLETLVGADALLANATAVLANQKQNPPANFEQLLANAGAGNALCVRVIRDAARELGHAIGMVCNVLNPNVVVLGGKLAQAADGVGVRAECEAGIRRSAISAACGDRFTLVKRGLQDPSAHGALLLGIEETTFDADGVPMARRAAAGTAR